MNLCTSRIIFSKRFQILLPVFDQITCTFKTGLYILGKVLRLSSQNIKTWCKNKLKFTKLKGLCLNTTDKLAKEWWVYVSSNSRFEISVEEISFQIMSFCFQFWMLLIIVLKGITQNVTTKVMQKAFRYSATIAISCYILLIFKRPKSFSKYTPVNYKSRSLRTSLEQTSADMEKNWINT